MGTGEIVDPNSLEWEAELRDLIMEDRWGVYMHTMLEATMVYMLTMLEATRPWIPTKLSSTSSPTPGRTCRRARPPT